MNLHVNIYHKCLWPGVHVWEKKWFRIRQFFLFILYICILYIYILYVFMRISISLMYMWNIYSGMVTFVMKTTPPPPPINLIFLVCCYSMSFHLNNNSSILACYIYTHVSSPFLLILVFLYAFCKEYTGIQKIYSTYL